MRSSCTPPRTRNGTPSVDSPTIRSAAGSVERSARRVKQHAAAGVEEVVAEAGLQEAEAEAASVAEAAEEGAVRPARATRPCALLAA